MVNLNVKSNYSLLSSMLRIDDIIKVALDNKSKAAFLCDNNMYGVMEFYKKCRNIYYTLFKGGERYLWKKENYTKNY